MVTGVGWWSGCCGSSRLSPTLGTHASRAEQRRGRVQMAAASEGQTSEEMEIPMNFDNALEMAVISSWDDFVKPNEHSSVHVEYPCAADAVVDSVQVWSVGKRGDAKRICDYSLGQPPDVGIANFMNAYHSNVLDTTLAFVLHNQVQFARRSDQCTQGLIRVDSPSTEDRARAETWRHDVGIVDLPGKPSLS
jgi:hypothetical protein